MGNGNEHRHANQHAQKLFAHHSHCFITVRVHHQKRSDGNPGAEVRIHIEQHELRNREGGPNELNRKPELRVLQAEVVLNKVQAIANPQHKRRRIIARSFAVAQRVHHRLKRCAPRSIMLEILQSMSIKKFLKRRYHGTNLLNASLPKAQKHFGKIKQIITLRLLHGMHIA